MKEFTYSEARQHLAALLERARRDGGVRIRRRDGQVFVLRPAEHSGSPLDVPGVDLDVEVQDIVDAVHEGRRPDPIPASAPPRRRPASSRRR